jgi:hypothetical protein
LLSPESPAVIMATWTQRVIGAARLDVATYEEVEADRGATGQAMLVVVLSALAAGIGAIGQSGQGPLKMAFAALFAWFVWAFVTWLVGTKILPGPETKADLGEMLRTIGFASGPGILRVLTGLPGIGKLIGALVAIWMLVAMVVAVRQALDYRSTGRAIAVCLIGFLFYVAALIAIGVVLGLGTWMLGSAAGRLGT